MNAWMVALSFFLTSCSAGDKLDMRMSPRKMVDGAEVKYGIPHGLLSALVEVESRWNVKAKVLKDGVSGHTSYGLTQIQLDSALFIQRKKAESNGYKITKKNRITAQELMIPEVNIDYGAAYLKWLLVRHKNNAAWALSCFNAGPNSGICKAKKYSNYVGLILNAYINKTGN